MRKQMIEGYKAGGKEALAVLKEWEPASSPVTGWDDEIQRARQKLTKR